MSARAPSGKRAATSLSNVASRAILSTMGAVAPPACEKINLLPVFGKRSTEQKTCYGASGIEHILYRRSRHVFNQSRAAISGCRMKIDDGSATIDLLE